MERRLIMPTPAQATIHSVLPRIEPEAAGLPSAQIPAFLDAIRAKGIRLHTFLAAKEGQVFAEVYYPPYSPTQLQQIFSLSKSFTSMALGMAVEEGRLKLTDRAASFFAPDDLPESYDPRLNELTLRDLLRMSTGQAQEPKLDDNSWVKNFFAEPMADEAAGLVFRYNTPATHLIAAVLDRIGIDLEPYLEERLLRPLGIEGTRWRRSPAGVCAGGFGFSAVPELIVKFGTLLLQEGRWEDRQLLPAWYVREATAKQIETVSDPAAPRIGDWAQGYGYQFWQCTHGCYRGDGMYGQFCVVSPSQRTVFAITCFTDDLQGVLDVLYEHILEPLQSEALAADPGACAALTDRLPQPTDPIPYPQPLAASRFQPELADKLNGKSLRVSIEQESLFGKTFEFTFQFEQEELALTWESCVFRAKNGGWLDTTATFQGLTDSRALTGYACEADSTLTVRLFLVEMMQDLLLRLTVSGDEVQVRFYDVHAGVEQLLLEISGNLR
jgi:CubicO group peptidase (beta-lactamase class C family)